MASKNLNPQPLRCPSCQVKTTFYDYTSVDHVSAKAGQQKGVQGSCYWRFTVAHCPVCEMPVVLHEAGLHDQSGKRPEKGRSIIWPLMHGRPPTPTEVREVGIKQDYEEACRVLPYSAQASAALGRRCLQALLRGPGAVTGKANLYQEIEDARPSLPAHLGEQLHVLREIGNIAAHPMKEQAADRVVPVEEGEAEYTLEVVEALFEHFYVGPARAAKMKAGVNEKLRKVGKKPLP